MHSINTQLAPCPICGHPPEHFYSGSYEVIHCLQGCKPHVFGWNVHLTNGGIRQLSGGWKKLVDKWNTITIFEIDGKREFKFDYYAPDEDGRIAHIIDKFLSLSNDRQYDIVRRIHTAANKAFKYPNGINKEYAEHLIGFSKRENVEHILNQLIPDNRNAYWC